MSWIFSNIKIIGVIAAILGVFSSGWYIERQMAESRLKTALESQETLLHAQCDAEKAVTKEANDELQKNRDSIARRLAALLQQTSRCVSVTGASNNRAGGAGYVGSNVSGDWLLRYAGQCEQYRSEVITLDKFLDNERK